MMQVAHAVMTKRNMHTGSGTPKIAGSFCSASDRLHQRRTRGQSEQAWLRGTDLAEAEEADHGRLVAAEHLSARRTHNLLRPQFPSGADSQPRPAPAI